MNFSLKHWIGQVTTGHGVMILGPTLLAVAGGTMTWETAVPLLLAGVVGLLWPENTTLKTAVQAAATDLEGVAQAYQTGQTEPTAGTPPDPQHPPALLGLTVLTAAAIGLIACDNMSPEERAADVREATAGIACLTETGVAVAPAAMTDDPDAVKAVNAAAAANHAVANDPACQAALQGAPAAAATIKP
jgi:hypothetical protein